MYEQKNLSIIVTVVLALVLTVILLLKLLISGTLQGLTVEVYLICGLFSDSMGWNITNASHLAGVGVGVAVTCWAQLRLGHICSTSPLCT